MAAAAVAASPSQSNSRIAGGLGLGAGHGHARSGSATSSGSNPLARIRALLDASAASAGAASSQPAVQHTVQDDGVNAGAGAAANLTRPRSRTDGGGSRPHSRSSQQQQQQYGGIGDSPAASIHRSRSRQNSGSSMGSASARFPHHRQSSSSATQDAHGGRNYRSKDTAISPQAQQVQPSQSVSNPSSRGTFPSIRGYSTLHDIARPRTPLYESRQQLQQQQQGPPQLANTFSSTADSGESYVASLGMAPLVTRPPQGGEPVYIPGGRAPTPQHLPSAFDASPNPASLQQKQARPTMHARSSSYNSYLGHSQQVLSSPPQPAKLHKRQNSRAATPQSRSRSRQNSQYSAASSGKGLGSRFIKYDNPIADSPRAKRRSSSFGAIANTPLFSGWSPNAPSGPSLQQNVSPSAITAETGGRRSRSRSRFTGHGQTASSSTEKRRYARKLVSARLPAHQRDHRDARLPSQPLGITWICGAGLVARDPSFYEDFEYAEYPGGRRKRSLSRSTITPSKYKNSMEASTEGGHGPLGYESEPENLDRRRARQASIDQYNREILADDQQRQQQEYTTGGPAIQVMSDAEKALRRKSQSLGNIRQTALEGDRTRAGGLFISAPLASARVPSSNDFVKTPRTAPFPDSRGFAPSTSVRRIPSKASIEAIDDPVKRREALFAALPPPNRRSPASFAEPVQMFSTGRVLSTTVGQPETSQFGQAFSTEGVLDDYTAGGDASQEAHDSQLSPGLEDIRHYEASAFILREGNNTPIVYGHAFSTGEDGPDSVEGEIIDDSRLSGLNTLESRQSGLSSEMAGRSLGNRSHSDRSMGQRSNSSRSFAQTPASHAASASSGSAHVLDLNDESFTNLFYKAPPPTKPLPSLPPSDSASDSLSGSGSRGYSPPVQLRSVQAVPEEAAEAEGADSVVHGSPSSPESAISPANSSGRESATHPTLSRQASVDDWINVDEGLLRGNRRMWESDRQQTEQPGYESEGEVEALQPPRFIRGSTASTYEESDYATANSANASTVALTEGNNSQRLYHAPSFLSAKSHITATSAAATIQGDTPGFERTFAFPTMPEPAREEAANETDETDPLATLRRTDLSPIYVSRQMPAFEQQLADSAPAVVSPRDTRRDSFIDFDVSTDQQAEVQARRASVDNRSFIDDDSDDEGHDLRPSAKADHMNRPSVIIEQAQEDNEDNTVHARPFGTLGVPSSGTASRDRSSAASHAHSVSNASFLSRLGDFPDPPNASASTLDLDPLASSATLVKPSGSTGTIRVVPQTGGMPSQTTLSTQNTSVYTFSSSDDGRRNSRLQAPEQDRLSFLDTSASPERPSSMPRLDKENSSISFYSGPNSPAIPATSASPSTPSFRLSGLFSKRPKHERTYSDPSFIARSSVSQYSRHNSGGFDSSDERRQSWRS